jgi:nucleoside-diphosphate-sugar epimerase
MAECDDNIGDTINIGSKGEVSIGELATKIIALVGNEAEIESEEKRLRPEKSEVNRLWCDNSKALKLLGWQPKYSLEEGLSETIDWIKNNLKHYKTDIYNV